MVNPKYYQDIKNFPIQFSYVLQNRDLFNISGLYERVLVCGVGGSSLYVELLNDYFATFTNFRLDFVRGYKIPNYVNNKTLFIIASHSGNTEETLTILDDVLKNRLDCFVFTSGGKLLNIAIENNISHYVLPSGVQPRLSTGYFISGVLVLLSKLSIINKTSLEDLLRISNLLENNLDESLAKTLAQRMLNKVVLIYSTEENSSIARISKIKFNENAKVPAFWNFFPELNHNEMVGFTNLLFDPFFLIFQSKFTNQRNQKRIEVLAEIMKEKDSEVEIVLMKGESVLEEILNAYYLVDHITYYLAEAYSIDPEPVYMVEDFKNRILK